MRLSPSFRGLIPVTLFFASLLLIQGCARPVLQTYPADARETEAALEAFARFRQISTEICGCCLDAEADAALAVSGWFSQHTGNLGGYLQAMAPGYIRFVAINPLGQPLLIFVTDGNMFTSLNVFAEKAYSGSVHSAAFQKFTPPGFNPEFSYYWLTGRLQPGSMRISAVLRDRERHNLFWLQIERRGSDTEILVLFDPQALLIRRHILRDERGRHLVDVTYENFQPPKIQEKIGSSSAAFSNSDGEEELCRLPAGITVSSRDGAEQIEVRLASFLAGARFSPAQFQVEIPDNFELLFVK